MMVRVTHAPLTTLAPALQRAIRHAMGAGIPRATIATWGGVHPTAVSQYLHGAVPVRYGDARIVRIGAALGVPADACFVAPAGAEGSR